MNSLKIALVVSVAVIAIASIAIVGYSGVKDDAVAAQVKSFKHKSDFDKESLQAYKAQRSAALTQLSEKQPDKQIQVAVSFKRPMAQTEIDAIKSQHGLVVEYFEYTATNNISGGAATKLHADLKQVSDYLKSAHNADAIGITYILATGVTAELQKLNQNNDVVLVDIGFVNEIEKENSEGNIGVQSLPTNLHQWYKKFE